jgi:hypothetical protein
MTLPVLEQNSQSETNQSLPTRSTPTDWDRYYQRPYKTASVTRAITGSHLINRIKRFAKQNPTIAELGGANSCFFELIQREVQPQSYHIVDNNHFGLQQFQRRIPESENVYLYEQDVMNLELEQRFDLVFSVGLIEHFDVAGTQKVIEAHFQLAKPGGIVLMTFPTPTWLYRSTRWGAEICRAWIFHDERPLTYEEVALTASDNGELLEKQIVWPIVLTQYHAVWRKSAEM